MIRRRSNLLGCLLAAAAPLAVGMAQAAPSVGTRDAQELERDFGRATADPYWAAREVEPVPAPLVRVYERGTDWLTQSAGHEPEPERYGRGGGYVGADQFETLNWTLRSQTTAAGSSGG